MVEHVDLKADVAQCGQQHISWGKVSNLHNLVRTSVHSAKAGFPFGKVKYRAKVKLHGTNASVVVDGDSVYAQSRSQVLVGCDNMGFAAWLKGKEDLFRKAVHELSGGPFVFFGEWCGPGIQAGTAINKIDRKVFVIYAVKCQRLGDHGSLEAQGVLFNGIIPEHEDIFSLDFLDGEYVIDFNDVDSAEGDIERLNRVVAQMEECDSFVADTFGVKGLGEGVVLYPTMVDGERVFCFEQAKRLMFKAKGEKHRTVKTKKAVQIKPEEQKTIDDFVRFALTGARLEQGLGMFERLPENTGRFIRWVSQDVNAECQAELEAAGLTWKQVSKKVARVAALYWKEQLWRSS